MGRRQAAKFWDNDLQRSRAYQMVKRYNKNVPNDQMLDYNDPAVRETLRGILRKRERNIKHNEDIATKVHRFVEDEIQKKMPKVISDNIKEYIPRKLQKQKEKESDPNSKPPPTGFKSDLPPEEWIPYYFPDSFKNGLYPIQKKILAELMAHPWSIVKVFRSAGKTKLATTLICYYICQDPNERIFIMTGEKKKGIQRLRMIRNMLGSPRIIKDYGYLINEGSNSSVRKGKNTEYLFECHRTIDAIEPTLMVITFEDDQAVGFHYTRGLMDDPWSNKLENQNGALEKWMERWGEFQGSLEQCQTLYILCTRKGVHDLYWKLELEKQFYSIEYPLVKKWPSQIEFIEDENGMYIGAKVSDDYEIEDDCFGKYSMEFENRDPLKGKICRCIPLIRKRDPIGFSREYQQVPYIPDGDLFKWKNCRLYNKDSSDPLVMGLFKQFSYLRTIGIMDMAFGLKEESDKNVLLVLTFYRGRFFVVDGWSGRWTIDERISIIKEMEAKYPGTPLYVESDLSQIHIVNDLKKKLNHLKIYEFRSRNHGTNYKNLFEGQEKAAKKGKIYDALAIPWSSSKIYLRTDLPVIEDLELQIKQFPRCESYDSIDALSMGIIVLRQFASGPAFAVSYIT